MPEGKLTHWARQCARGCMPLPHVGPHPGVAPLALFTGAGVAAGLQHGVPGVLICGGLMLSVIGTIFLAGAYGRAELSDKLAALALTEQKP